MIEISKLNNTRWLQWAAGFGAHLMLLVGGLTLGWSSPYLAQLTAPDSWLPVTEAEASWVASLVNLGRLFGAVLGSFSVQYLGSKNTLVLIGFPFILSWISLILANSVTWLYVARFSAGISIGMTFSSFPLFLGEISSPAIRGALVTLGSVGITLGTFAGNIIGAYISMASFSYVSLVPNVIFVIVFITVPESPHHLIRKGKLEAAKKSLVKYNPKANAKAEVDSLEEFVRSSDSMNFKNRLREFNITRNRKAGLIGVLLFTFLQFSGLSSVTFYMEIILTDAKMTIMNPALMVIILGGVGVVAGFFAMSIADKCGRKILMAGSCFGVALAMTALGVHFVLLEQGFDPAGLQWLPISSLAGYQVFVYLGVSPVPSMVIGEIFAPNIKSLAACLASIAAGISGFISTKTYQPLVDALGQSYVFWIQALIMVLAVIFILTVVPETRGKSLQEIQNKLSRQK